MRRALRKKNLDHTSLDIFGEALRGGEEHATRFPQLLALLRTNRAYIATSK